MTDYTQAAQRKYKKLMRNIKPDMQTYEEQKDEAIYAAATDETDFYRGVDSLAYASVENKPKPENVDRMVQDLNKQ
jgi:pre-mRNA-splicing factor SYF2